MNIKLFLKLAGIKSKYFNIIDMSDKKTKEVGLVLTAKSYTVNIKKIGFYKFYIDLPGLEDTPRVIRKGSIFRVRQDLRTVRLIAYPESAKTRRDKADLEKIQEVREIVQLLQGLKDLFLVPKKETIEGEEL